MNANGFEVTLWGNTRHATDTITFNKQAGEIDHTDDWPNTKAIHEMDGMLYVMQNSVLHRVTPNYGTHPNGWSYIYSTTIWSYGLGFQDMATMDEDVYVMQNKVLHRVTPSDTTGPWPYVHSTTPWHPSFRGIATMDDGYVYVNQNGVLHRVTPESSDGPWSYNPYLNLPSSDYLRAAFGRVYQRLFGSQISEYNSSLSLQGGFN